MLKVYDLVKGVPIVSSHGFLGWSSVSLVHDDESDDYILLDCGGFNNRLQLIENFKRLSLSFDRITKIALTHLHFDHCMNIELFPKATIYIGKKEFDYAFSNEPARRSDMFIPIPYLKEIIRTRNVVEVKEGYKIHSSIIAINLPGHTPGSMGYFIRDENIIFVGDAIKNAYELINTPTICYDSLNNWKKSLNKILNLAKTIIPGHDGRLKIKKNKVTKIGKKITVEFEVTLGEAKKTYKIRIY